MILLIYPYSISLIRNCEKNTFYIIGYLYIRNDSDFFRKTFGISKCNILL